MLCAVQDWNFLVPSLTTLKNHFERTSYDFGLQPKAVEQMARQIKANPNFTNQCIVAFDEVHVRKGIVFDKEGNMLGTVDGVVPLDKALASAATADLATQIQVFTMATLDGKFRRPIAWYATTNMKHTQIIDILETIESLFNANDLVLAAISGDGARTNMSVFEYFQKLGRFISHPDYPHVLKNIRNHISLASRDKKDMMLDGQVLSFAIMDKYPDLFVKAVAKDLRFPTDKQNVEAAVDLFSLKNIALLRTLTHEPSALALATFFEAAYNLYHAHDVALTSKAQIYRPTSASHPNTVLTLAERRAMIQSSLDVFNRVCSFTNCFCLVLEFSVLFVTLFFCTMIFLFFNVVSYFIRSMAWSLT